MVRVGYFNPMKHWSSLVCILGLMVIGSAKAGTEVITPQESMIPPPIDTIDTLDLLTAINIALVNNRKILSAALTVEDRGYAIQGEKAAFDIQATPSGTASTSKQLDETRYGVRLSQKLSWGTEVGVDGGYTTRKNSDGDTTEGARVRFDLSQPLFSEAGRLIHLEPLRAAEEQFVDAKRSLGLRKEDIVVEVVGAYEAVLSGIRKVEIDEQSVERLQKLFDLTRTREAQGRSSKVDTLRVELQLGESKSRLANSEEQLQTSQQDFANLLGYRIDATFQLIAPPIMDIDVPNYEAAFVTALSNRLDYAQAIQRLDTADRQLAISRKRLQPDLGIRSSYTLTGGQDDRDSLDLREEDWFVGLTIGSDLNRSREKAQYQGTRIRLSQTQLQLEDIQYEIARDVRQLIRAYRRSIADWHIKERNAALASKRFELAEAYFRLGKGDNFSVTDAEASWLEAESALLDARAEASLTGYRLLRGMGLLLPHDASLKPFALTEKEG